MIVKTLQIVWHDKLPVLSCDYHASGVLVTAGADREIKAWSLEQNELEDIIVSYKGSMVNHSKAVNCVRFRGDCLLSAGDGGEMMMWGPAVGPDTESGVWNWKVKQLLRGHSDDVIDVAWAHDGSGVASAGIDNSIILWDLAKGKRKKTIGGHRHYVQGVAWDPLGEYIISLSTDRTMRALRVSAAKKRSRHTQTDLAAAVDFVHCASVFKRVWPEGAFPGRPSSAARRSDTAMGRAAGSRRVGDDADGVSASEIGNAMGREEAELMDLDAGASACAPQESGAGGGGGESGPMPTCLDDDDDVNGATGGDGVMRDISRGHEDCCAWNEAHVPGGDDWDVEGGLAQPKQRASCSASAKSNSMDAPGTCATYVFQDESINTFFRRVAFSPDGSFAVAPAATLGPEAPAKGCGSAAAVFARGSLSEPAALLPSLTSPSTCVRFSPVFYHSARPGAQAPMGAMAVHEVRGEAHLDGRSGSGEARPALQDGVQAGRAECVWTQGNWTQGNSSPTGTDTPGAPGVGDGQPLMQLGYKLVFAVGTTDSIFIYDTDSDQPRFVLGAVHLKHVTDLAWAPDGNTMVATSHDGYCTLVRFQPGELGDPLPSGHRHSAEAVRAAKEIKKEARTAAKRPKDTPGAVVGLTAGGNWSGALSADAGVSRPESKQPLLPSKFLEEAGTLAHRCTGDRSAEVAPLEAAQLARQCPLNAQPPATVLDTTQELQQLHAIGGGL